MVVLSICRWESMSWPETGTKMWRVKPVNGNSFFTEFIFITVCTNSVMSIRFISSTNFPHPIGSLAEISTYFPKLLQRGLVREQFFFRTTQELQYLFFCRAKREFFFQNLILGYMTKTLNQIIFFSSTKIRIFFSATLGIFAMGNIYITFIIHNYTTAVWITIFSNWYLIYQSQCY
jgi:hypothetical protein